MPSKPLFDVDVVRQYAQRRVTRASLREVAEEIGISKSGLDHFLKGRRPYSRTQVRLAAWYGRQRRLGADSVTEADVAAAVAVLERYVQSVGSAPARERRAAAVAKRVAEVIRSH